MFPMNGYFDVILGRDCCNRVSCDILYSAGLIKFQSPATGKVHEIILQPVSHDHGTVYPVISYMDIDKHIETGDTVYTCHVTAQENGSSDHDKVQVILKQYRARDVFPDELPAEFLLSAVFITPFPSRTAMLHLLHASHTGSVNLKWRSVSSKSLHCWQRVTYGPAVVHMVLQYFLSRKPQAVYSCA